MKNKFYNGISTFPISLAFVIASCSTPQYYTPTSSVGPFYCDSSLDTKDLEIKIKRLPFEPHCATYDGMDFPDQYWIDKCYEDGEKYKAQLFQWYECKKEYSRQYVEWQNKLITDYKNQQIQFQSRKKIKSNSLKLDYKYPDQGISKTCSPLYKQINQCIFKFPEAPSCTYDGISFNAFRCELDYHNWVGDLKHWFTDSDEKNLDIVKNRTEVFYLKLEDKINGYQREYPQMDEI